MPGATKATIDARYRLRVRQRRRVVEFVTAHEVQPASDRFGLDRRTASGGIAS